MNYINNTIKKYYCLPEFLLGALYLLFPTITNISNLPLFLLVAYGLFITSPKNVFKEIKENPVALGFFLLYGMVILGCIYTQSSWEWVSLHLNKYGKFFYVIIIIIVLKKNNKYQRIAFNSFNFSMFFILVSTWLNIWFLLPWSISQDPGWGKSHHVFGDYITQNVMMSFFVIISLKKSIDSSNIKTKVFWVIITILAGVSITHLSQGRSGLILLITGLISYAAVSVSGMKLWKSLMAIAVIFIIAIGSSNMIKNRLITAYEEAQRNETDHLSSIGHRLYNYKLTPILISEKPIFGHGTGAYHIEVCKLIENKDLCPIFSRHPHNQFLFFGVDHGMIGICLYLFLIASLYYTAKKSIDSNTKILLFSLTSMLVIDSFFNSPLFSSRENQFFIYMIALLVSMANPIQKNN